MAKRTWTCFDCEKKMTKYTWHNRCYECMEKRKKEKHEKETITARD